MLPVLLDMMDEIYGGMDQSQAPSHYPLLFLQQRPGGGHGLRRHGGWGLVPSSNDFTVTLDVKNFKPEEIEVKVKDREIIIEGKHEERRDNHGFVSRQFSRRYLLPEEFDPDTIATYLTAEGKMTVKAEKPKPQIDQTQARVIPIQRMGPEAPAAVKQSEKAEGAEK